MKSFTFALLLFVGCSQAPRVADAGSDDAGQSISPVDLCERLAAMRCGVLNRCFPAFARESASDCGAHEQSRCLATFEQFKTSIESKAMVAQVDHLAACETRMATSQCPPSFPPGYLNTDVVKPFADCDFETGLFAGTVASLHECENATDCVSGTVCVKPSGVCRGTCSAAPTEGEACGFGCATGLICDAKGTPNDTSDDRCVLPQGAGATCATSSDCPADLICLAQQCAPRIAVGQTCQWDAARLSPCEPGFVCDVVPYVASASGKCVLPRSEGDPCHYHWSCGAGLICSGLDWSGFPQTAPSAGTCKKPIVAGQACTTSVYAQYIGDECASGTACNADTGQCTALPNMGSACFPSQQNCLGIGVYCKPSGSGDIGNCTGPAQQNETCSFEIDSSRSVQVPCSTGFCDVSGTQTCRPPSKVLNDICESNGECVSGRCTVAQDAKYRCANACQ